MRVTKSGVLVWIGASTMLAIFLEKRARDERRREQERIARLVSRFSILIDAERERRARLIETSQRSTGTSPSEEPTKSYTSPISTDNRFWEQWSAAASDKAEREVRFLRRMQERLGREPLFQIHDTVVFEVPEPENTDSS